MRAKLLGAILLAALSPAVAEAASWSCTAETTLVCTPAGCEAAKPSLWDITLSPEDASISFCTADSCYAGMAELLEEGWPDPGPDLQGLAFVEPIPTPRPLSLRYYGVALNPETHRLSLSQLGSERQVVTWASCTAIDE